MKTHLMLAGALSLIATMAAAEDKPVLTVYAPDYFTSEWGPGPAIEKGFEATCDCDLKFVAGDVLPRILLEGDKTSADVAIGLNTDVTAKARATGLFAPHNEDTSDLTMPVKWDDPIFLPFDWSELAFVYDKTKLKNPPTSFQDLLDAPDDAYKIVIEDPRSSVAGLSLLLWVKDIYGDKAEDAWTKIAPKVLTVTPGWSEAYGMFTDGEADMVLSYVTSPAYHIMAEEDDSKAAAIFPEGHYFTPELVAQLKTSKHPELAQKFMDYVLSPDFQGMIATANWSFPAKLPHDQLPEVFQKLPMPDKTLYLGEAEAEKLRGPALDEWQRAFSR
ncbi:thiamine ABC transporter substrate binding subunit [Thioclava nitratireducens]|uniref:thiamine ABC transporter substrate binding subunit n=1 Tax=Thioclava nitratireducens TaxID=1915078 RepID=UPI002480C765|nr:thiamine ABC transporter substrate binding subunit [Thioclava nitratireducens]WGT49435.1 thiamine ABC transporter substrate binding subunit [Thioclava nitratireducens]